MATSRTPSRGRSAASSNRPAMPVINGVEVPHGVCGFAFRGERCPYLSDKAKYPDGCKFSHDVAKFKKPAAPAPEEPPRQAAPAEITDQRSANSPRATGDGGNTDHF